MFSQTQEVFFGAYRMPSMTLSATHVITLSWVVFWSEFH